MMHGFRSNPIHDFSCAFKFYYDKGFNLFVPDQRAHGKSQGKFITYGVKERVDAKCWVDYINTLVDNGEIYMTGVSMGATTVLMATELSLPQNVKVTHLESFGAFCDIGCGNIALLPIDSISVSRITHPSDRFVTGDNIKVIVKSIAPNGRITLSHKELLGTWSENAERFSAGQTVSGIVRSIESYGIFVELAPNLAGLAESKEGVKVGERACVYIKSIIPDKMKIKLIIIDSFDNNEAPDYEYFYYEDRMDSFVYSPPESLKIIETVF